MTISAESIDLLQDQRTETQKFFDEQKLQAQQIITVDIQITPARVLAYQYYGSSELGANIALLNDEINVAYLDRETEIFSA